MYTQVGGGILLVLRRGVLGGLEENGHEVSIALHDKNWARPEQSLIGRDSTVLSLNPQSLFLELELI